ncbi:unnamed protein product, partial [Staurois parvus]
SSGHTPRINPSPVIGRRNCSSGEAHRRPITGEEVELGEEEPSGTAKIERVKRRRVAGEGRHLTEGGSERAQAGAGVSKVSIIGVSGRNSAPSLVSLIPMMGHYSSPH